MEFGSTLTAGLEYKRNQGGWHVVKEASPWVKYDLTGEAETQAHIELRLVSDLEISFYGTATGRLILEPYLYADAAVEGHFLYQYEDSLQGSTQLSDADYRFTDLQFGVGMDAKFRAGLKIFDRSIVGYPSNDQSQFDTFSIIDRKPVLGIPELAANTDLTPLVSTDSRAIRLQGGFTNVPNPFYPLLSERPSLNPFNEASGQWQVVFPRGSEQLLRANAAPLDRWFVYSVPDIYTVRFSGHSELGSFIRQYKDVTIDARDLDGDGMADIWEQRWGVSEPNGKYLGKINLTKNRV